MKKWRFLDRSVHHYSVSGDWLVSFRRILHCIILYNRVAAAAAAAGADNLQTRGICTWRWHILVMTNDHVTRSISIYRISRVLDIREPENVTPCKADNQQRQNAMVTSRGTFGLCLTWLPKSNAWSKRNDNSFCRIRYKHPSINAVIGHLGLSRDILLCPTDYYNTHLKLITNTVFTFRRR